MDKEKIEIMRIGGVPIMDNFPKDVTNIIFHDYCGSLSNRVCKLSVH